MKLNRLEKKKIKRVISERNEKYQFSSGIEAKFFDVDGVGIKLYRRKESGRFARITQSFAAEHGLAPEVYERINVKGVGFGFVTEVADTSIECWWDNDEDYAEELEEELSNISIFHGDLHAGNVGELDGNIVCIDFGPAGTST